MRLVVRTPPTRTCEGSFFIKRKIDYRNQFNEKQFVGTPNNDSEPAWNDLLSVINKNH